jgi:hypothetical protein
LDSGTFIAVIAMTWDAEQQRLALSKGSNSVGIFPFQQGIKTDPFSKTLFLESRAKVNKPSNSEKYNETEVQNFHFVKQVDSEVPEVRLLH